MDNTDANKILARDDITDEQRQIALNFKDGIASIKEFKALKLDLDKLDKIKAIEDEDERHNQYMDYINDKNAASYAKKILVTDPYWKLNDYLRQVTIRYLGNKGHEFMGFRDELEYIIYKPLRQALIDYMEGDIYKIIIGIPKCILYDFLHRAFTSPDGVHDIVDYDDSVLDDELDNMDWDDDDNFEIIELDNPGFINYNPEYWIPESYPEFRQLLSKIPGYDSRIARDMVRDFEIDINRYTATLNLY
jgi:hypothetical protein